MFELERRIYRLDPICGLSVMRGKGGMTEADKKENLPQVLLFGGTTEGRVLAEWLGARGTCRVLASSLTVYGGALVRNIPNVTALTGRMERADMERLLRGRPFACVVDATHPYAVSVTESVAAAAQACGVPRLRVVREGEPQGSWVGVPGIGEAAAHVAACPGKVLLTTGSNDLAAFAAAMPDFRERLYVRVLPVQASIEKVAGLGIPASHVVAMQGPFSRDFNAALIRELGVQVVVTKASGAAGGFWEKVQAAQDCGVQLVVIHRPVEEAGLTLPEAQQALAQRFGL